MVLPVRLISGRRGFIQLYLLGQRPLLLYIYGITDPELLARRVNAGPGAEKERTQKIIQFLASIFFLAVLIIPSFDHRYRVV